MKRFILAALLGFVGLSLESGAYCIYNNTRWTIEVEIESLGWEKTISPGENECWNWADCCDARDENLRVRVTSYARFKADLSMRAGGWINVDEVIESEVFFKNPENMLQIKARSWYHENGTNSLVDYDPPTSTPNNRRVEFLVTGDPQFNQHELSETDPAWVRGMTNATMSKLIERFSENSNMRGILVAGDLTQNASDSEFEAYLDSLSGYDEYFYEGLGNHDFSTKSFGWFLDPDADASDDIRDYVARNDPDDEGYGGRSTRYASRSDIHYSWDWHDVHFVQLNLAPINELITGENDPRNALTFLESDLANNVGNSGRPVILIFHYGFEGFSFPYWWGGPTDGPERMTAFWNAIRNHNVAAIFTGHVHTATTWEHPFGYGQRVGRSSTGYANHLTSAALPRRDGRKTIPTFVSGGATNDDTNYFIEAKIQGTSFTVERFKMVGNQANSTVTTSSAGIKVVDLFWDDHSDLRDASATEFEEDVEVEGAIFDLNDQDVFRFTLSQTEEIVVDVAGFETMRTRLYNSSGAVLVDSENGSLRITGELSAGTYYVMTSLRKTTPYRAYGNYELKFRFGVPQVKVNPSNGFTYNVGRGAGTIAENFQIQNLGEATLHWSIEDDPALWWVDFYPKEGTLGPSNQELVQFVATPETLGPGTYTVPIKVEDTALRISDTINLTVVVTGPADDYVGRGTAASDLPGGLGGTVNGALEVESDQDFFRFEVTEAGVVEFFTESDFSADLNEGLFLKLYDDDPGLTNGEQLLSQVSSGDENDVYVRYFLEPGFYNVALSSIRATGSYALHSNFYLGAGGVELQMFPDGDEADLLLMSGLARSHILMSSPDLKRWNYWDADGGTYNLGTPYGEVWRRVPMNQGEQFFRVVASPRAPVIAGRLFTSGAAAGSASFYQKNGVPGVVIGEPANFADTAITLGGDALRQRDGVMMASGHHWGNGLPGVIRVPGELTDPVDPDLFFPNGTWFASNHPGGGEITSILSYAHFPYNNGWQGGYVDPEGEVLAGNRENPFPIVHMTAGLFVANGGGKPSEGALFVVSPKDSLPQVVSTLADGDNGWGIAVRGAASAAFEEGSVGYLYLPYATENVAAGQVDASGQVVNGTGGFTVTKQSDHYEIRLTGDLDASKGILLVNACQQEGSEPADNHFGWKLEGEVLKVWSYDLPLESPPNFEDCGFSFAFIPTDRLIFHPDE